LSFNKLTRCLTLIIKDSSYKNVKINSFILIVILLTCVAFLGLDNMFFRGASYSQLDTSLDYLLLESLTYIAVFITLLFYERYKNSIPIKKYPIMLFLLL